MSIADYSDLTVQVSEYTGRDDFVQMFPRALSFAEKEIERRLRVSDMIAIAELITDTEGSATLPADYLEMIEVLSPAGKPLAFSPVNALDEAYRLRAGTAAHYFTLNGMFFCVPKQSGSFTITYYDKIPALTSTATSNWLLSRAPKIYLYAASAEVLLWAVSNGRETDRSKLDAMRALLSQEIDEFQRYDTTKTKSNAKLFLSGVNP